MKKIIIYIFAVLTAFSTTINAKERELDHPTITFEKELIEGLPHYEVKLKAVKFWCGDFDSSLQDVTISYVVTLNYALSKRDGTVYLSLQDEEGFEFAKRELQGVVENYTGTLKGNFKLKPQEYQKLANAELFFMVTVKN